MPTVTDTFDRANGALGANWTTTAGAADMVIAGNAAVPSDEGSDCGAVHTGAAWAADQSSKGVLSTTSTGGFGEGPCLVVRGASGSITEYRAAFNHAASSNIEIARFNAGSFTSLAVRTAAWVDAVDEWELAVSGSTGAVVLTLKLNGVQQGATISDTSGSGIASGSPGIAYSSVAGSDRILTWTGSDGAAAPVIPTLVTAPMRGY